MSLASVAPISLVQVEVRLLVRAPNPNGPRKEARLRSTGHQGPSGGLVRYATVEGGSIELVKVEVRLLTRIIHSPE